VHQEFYELFLHDSKSAGKLVYYVREAHALWSEIDGQIMWEEEQVQVFNTHEEANKRYAERRLTLAQQVFIHSDMDLH
jgi:hypothetical protein